MNRSNINKDKNDKDNSSGYPVYPETEDIYNKFKEEQDIDPEDISKKKVTSKNDDFGTNFNEKTFHDDVSGSDLDIPGSELDDEQEEIGNEDEENNYYSLGGDNHGDLDEDNGD
ncbi:MAG: hypothetical protein HYZ42_07675 [Bacteroidetes bacterium]|nr:hypothetical protein [Bacteroidota bacterium]